MRTSFLSQSEPITEVRTIFNPHPYGVLSLDMTPDGKSAGFRIENFNELLFQCKGAFNCWGNHASDDGPREQEIVMTRKMQFRA